MIIREHKILFPANSTNLLQNSSGESAERDLRTPPPPVTDCDRAWGQRAGVTEPLQKTRQATKPICCLTCQVFPRTPLYSLFLSLYLSICYHYLSFILPLSCSIPTTKDFTTPSVSFFIPFPKLYLFIYHQPIIIFP